MPFSRKATSEAVSGYWFSNVVRDCGYGVEALMSSPECCFLQCRQPPFPLSVARKAVLLFLVLVI